MRYVFSDFELEPDSYRLVRAGVDVRVEPRVLELLALLVAERHRLVTKEELVERLWTGQFVSDGVLSRAVYEARRAVGDDSRGQRYIKTVHGRGYQFVAEVEEVVEDAAPRSAPPPPDPTGPERAASASRSRPSVEAARGLRRPLMLWSGLAAVLALAGAAFVVNSRSGPATGVEGETARRDGGHSPQRLAILPMVATDAVDAELGLVALSFTDLFNSRLQRVEGLIVRAPESDSDIELRVDSLQEYARRAGVDHLLTGSLRSSSGRAQLDLTIELLSYAGNAAARRTPLGRYSIQRLDTDADLEAFLAVRDAVVDRVLELMGPAVVDARGAGAAPRDPEAYRLYLLAYRKLLENYCGGGAADELAHRSLEIDPEFALAWDVLATAYYNRVWACGDDASLYEEAIAASDRAIALDPALPNPRYRKISLLIETGRVEEAYALIGDRLAERPDSPRGLNAQSYALRVAGFLEPSRRALDRLLEVDPLVFDVGALGGSPNTYLYEQRIGRFLEVLPASTMPYIRFYRGFGELLRGDPQAASAELESAFRTGPGEVFGRLAHALLAIIEGDREAAREIVESVARQRQRLGGVDGEITYKEAQILALAGVDDAAMARLEAALDQGFFCLPCLATDPSLETLRTMPRWPAFYEAAQRRHQAFAERFGLDPEA